MKTQNATDHRPIDPEARLVFSLKRAVGERPVVVVMMTPAAWDYIDPANVPQDQRSDDPRLAGMGMSHHFDLSSAGLPIAFVFAGVASRARAVEIIEQHNRSQGVTTVRSAEDFGIGNKSPPVLKGDLRGAAMELVAAFQAKFPTLTDRQIVAVRGLMAALNEASDPPTAGQA